LERARLSAVEYHFDDIRCRERKPHQPRHVGGAQAIRRRGRPSR
jgi:hypothetical protein